MTRQRRAGALLVLHAVLTGCSFDGRSGIGLDAAIDSGAQEASVDAPVLDAPPDVARAFCSDPGVVACYELDGTTIDTTPNQLDASMSNVTFGAGRVNMALVLSQDSRVDVPDSPRFDVAALSMDAWIRPTALPAAGARAGILDMEGQYGFFLHDGGRLACSAGGASGLVDAAVTPGVWTHVACTYDGVTRRIWVNGVSISETTGGPIATGGAMGLALGGDNPAGSRLIGMLDQVRLWSRAMTGDEICVAAGCR